MKVTSITVKLGITASRGNYQNIRPEVEVTGELAAGDDPKAAYAELAEFAREAMVAEVQQLIPDSPYHLKGALILVGVERTEAQRIAFPVAEEDALSVDEAADLFGDEDDEDFDDSKPSDWESEDDDEPPGEAVAESSDGDESDEESESEDEALAL